MATTPRNSRANRQPVIPQGEVVADFSQYAEAVAYVENLVRNNFPAASIAIVGSDLRSVERVRGRLSYARIALSGATTGAWMGLIIGFLFGPSVDTATAAGSLNSVGSSVIIGAGIGMLLNVIRFSLMRNKRGYISTSSVVAAKYQVQVPGNLVEQANQAAAAKPAA